ncbi:MAG: biotin/lipoyl-containing protein [Bacteroidota bacterium]
MLKVKVNNKKEHAVELISEREGSVNGKKFAWDAVEIKPGTFHILKDDTSYTAEVVKADHKTKTFTVKVNGNKYTLQAKDKYDELLEKLGMDAGSAARVNDMKAPMPGLVLDIRVNEGSAVKKGDALIVLEAMKMENILKSPADGTIKKVNVKKGAAVEKNQVLVTYE